MGTEGRRVGRRVRRRKRSARVRGGGKISAHREHVHVCHVVRELLGRKRAKISKKSRSRLTPFEPV